MKRTTNWISDPQNLSYPDKINRLIEIKDKLVLVQFDEIQRLKRKTSGRKPNEQEYIDQLYRHYIVKGMPKLYLC